MRRITLLLSCLAMIACTKEERVYTKQIDIDFKEKGNDTFALSQIIEDVTYIKLDTSCFIGQIDEIKMHAGTYYICNKCEGAIHRFGKDGKHIMSLKKRGRARNEYIVINDFDVSPLNGEIHIYDSSSKRIMVYTKDGVFMRAFPTDDIIRDFAVMSNGDYLIYTPDQNGDARRGLWKTDSVGNFKEQLVIIDEEFQYGGLYPQYLFRIDDNQIGLMGGEDADNFYSISEKAAHEWLHLNYNITIPPSIQKERNPDFMKYKGKLYTKNTYSETHRWLWFHTTDLETEMLCIYDKSNDACYKLTRQEQLTMDRDMFGYTLSCYNDTFVNVIDAHTIISDTTLHKRFPDITENSNPVLEIAKATE